MAVLGALQSRFVCTPKHHCSAWHRILVWAILGPLGAVPQGMIEDVGLFVIGVIATVVVIACDGRARSRAITQRWSNTGAPSGG